MLNKLWRYSHLGLTVSSFLFLLLATITGSFLAFEPIYDKLQPYHINEGEDVTLSELITNLHNQYDEILTIEVDKNYFVKADVFSIDEAGSGEFYINPFNGNKIADIPPKKLFFEFLTNFHRSLFLKTPGRIFVGITCFFLFLIAITGLGLAIKRQGGLIKFYSKIINDKSIQYNHVALGRLLLVPIVVIALSGTYLSMDRFSLLPKIKETANQHTLTTKDALPFTEFPVFKNTSLKDIKKLEFPFSTDAEDFFILSLQDKEMKIHQKTGEVVETLNYAITKKIAALSFDLHTGAGSIFWSLVLFISSLSILYFIYSGSIITFQRVRSSISNTFKFNQATIIILVGSENGNTKRLGKILQQSLVKAGKKVFLDTLNNYRQYENIDQLLIITSTYGQGEPPSNAGLFINKLQSIKIIKPFSCHVIGLGSYSYPLFCEFAKKIYSKALLHKDINVPSSNPLLIHNQNYQQFRKWALDWALSLKINLELPMELATKKEKETVFKVIAKQNVIDPYDETFKLTLTTNKNGKVVPGDLIGFTPPNETQERLYSVGKSSDGHLLLSVKRHTLGVCSNFLNELKIDQEVKGKIKKNEEFYLPTKSPQIVLIANGTGIAPFLGMIHQKSQTPIRLYWGTRTKKSEELYKPQIDEALQNETLQQYHVAFSKEDSAYNYVQDLILRDKKMIATLLSSGGALMICGSIVMRDTIYELLEKICEEYQLQSLEVYLSKNQILTDCY
ncbi:PepSY domain-containing protein [Aquimarina sp. W85]|uniref:PepSY domain-containing protein n=1 Tax=Aquimarina rhodophyticola TaxID=3342246 RepID=UPI00366FD303